jgi:hypothetical protein
MSGILGSRTGNKQQWCRPLQGVVRAVCAIIDAFHFLPPAEAAAAAGANGDADPDADMAEAAANQASKAASAAIGNEAAGLNGGTRQQEADELVNGQKKAAEAAAAQAADIRAALLKRVLPALSKQLVAKGDVSGQSAMVLCLAYKHRLLPITRDCPWVAEICSARAHCCSGAYNNPAGAGEDAVHHKPCKHKQAPQNAQIHCRRSCARRWGWRWSRCCGWCRATTGPQRCRGC